MGILGSRREISRAGRFKWNLKHRFCHQTRGSTETASLRVKTRLRREAAAAVRAASVTRGPRARSTAVLSRPEQLQSLECRLSAASLRPVIAKGESPGT